MKLKANLRTSSFSQIGHTPVILPSAKSEVGYRETKFNEYSPFMPSKSKDDKLITKKQ